MNMNPLSLLEKAINEHGSSTILKERIALVKDELTKVVKEKNDLEARLEKAKDEIKKLKSLIPNTRFVEYGGVKFKRKAKGGFEKTVYCPSCEVGMAKAPDEDLPFVCGKCNSLSGFSSGEFPSVFREMEDEYS